MRPKFLIPGASVRISALHLPSVGVDFSMKLVLIEWLDSHAGRGWQTMDRIEQAAEPLYCRSVGWLVSQSGGCKVIVPHIAGEKNGELPGAAAPAAAGDQGGPRLV